MNILIVEDDVRYAQLNGEIIYLFIFRKRDQQSQDKGFRVF